MMYRKFILCFLTIFFWMTLFINNSFAQNLDEGKIKLSEKQLRPVKIKNLQQLHFAGRTEIVKEVDWLADHSSQDPYAASLPLMASSELGDAKRYKIFLKKMQNTLLMLEQRSESMPEWMRNHSFKAWMWGRILLAAEGVDDDSTALHAKKMLDHLLKQKPTKDDKLAFSAWGWGYRAAYDQTQYDISKEKMMHDGLKLNEKYNQSKTHDALSDALWVWVMNIQAAAYAGDQKTYHFIKKQMMLITQTNTVAKALEKGLLRSASSNDYPAWAMAKVRHAAIVMQDLPLYKDIEKPLLTSIENAKKADAKAEYILSTLDNQLAVFSFQSPS